MSTDNEQNKIEKLAAELAKAKREIDTLRREKKRVGLSFHRIPETGYDISRLWNGDFPYLQKLPTNSLEKQPSDETFSADANTVLIEADNLAVLMAMQLTHKGKIDVIYIDPPYNTGNNDFIYRDARKSSMKDVEGASSDDYEKTLDGKARTVGKDDPERHSLWLSFMERRLWLAKNLLSPRGFIFISIDDNEQANLKVLADGIFGEGNFIACVPHRTKSSGKVANHYASNHDYVLVYGLNKIESSFNQLAHNDAGFKFKDDFFEERGYYKLNQTLDYNSLQYNKSMDYPIQIEGEIIYPGGSEEAHIKRHSGVHNATDWVWRWSKDLFDFGLRNGFVVIKKTQNGTRIYTKTYLNAKIEKNISGYSVVQSGRTKSTTSLEYVNSKYSNDEGTKEIAKILGDEAKFSYPKSTIFIKEILKISSQKDSVILDFFAGSGTTAHAVAELNKEDGGNRQCILVTHGDENGENIAEDVTAERMKRVLSGKNWADGKEHEPLIGSLYYYKLLFAPKTTNPLTAMETMQTRFTGLAALEQNAHVELENTGNYTVLMNSTKVVVVWKNEDALLDEPEVEFYPLLNRLKEEYPDLTHIVYTPSNQSSTSDEYGVESMGWSNYSYPMEYITAHAGLLERMKRNKTMLQPYVDEASDDELDYESEKSYNEDVETETNISDSEEGVG